MAATVDNLDLERWRTMDAAEALLALADYAKRDPSFTPRGSNTTTRWNVSVGGKDHELLCSGPKFFDTRASKGGGGAVDLVMHLFDLPFKRAVRTLREKRL